MLWSCDIYQDLLWAKMYINTFHVFISLGEQAGRHIHIYTSMYIRLCYCRFRYVWFCVDSITRTRYLRKPSASASPIACDLNTRIQTASESSQSCHLSTCKFPKTSTKHIFSYANRPFLNCINEYAVNYEGSTRG